MGSEVGKAEEDGGERDLGFWARGVVECALGEDGSNHQEEGEESGAFEGIHIVDVL